MIFERTAATMLTMDSEYKAIRWPKDWLKIIDELRGKQSFSEFVKDCVAARIGKRKLSEAPGPGRPKKSDETPIDNR